MACQSVFWKALFSFLQRNGNLHRLETPLMALEFLPGDSLRSSVRHGLQVLAIGIGLVASRIPSNQK